MGNGEQCWLASEVSDDKAVCLHVSIFNVMNAFVLKGLGGEIVAVCLAGIVMRLVRLLPMKFKKRGLARRGTCGRVSVLTSFRHFHF